MSKRLLLVDLENVPQIDLSCLEEGFKINIFVGSGQKSISIDLVTSLQELSNNVQWVRVPGQGKNALDLFIAYWIGRIYALPKNRDTEIVILSKDKGYDQLVHYLKAMNFNCSRVENLTHMVVKAQQSDVTTNEYSNMDELEVEDPE